MALGGSLSTGLRTAKVQFSVVRQGRTSGTLVPKLTFGTRCFRVFAELPRRLAQGHGKRDQEPSSPLKNEWIEFLTVVGLPGHILYQVDCEQ